MQAFLKKEGGRPSGPPTERALSIQVISETKKGVKITVESPVVAKDWGCIPGST